MPLTREQMDDNLDDLSPAPRLPEPTVPIPDNAADRARYYEATDLVHKEPRPPIEQVIIAVTLADEHGMEYADNPVTVDSDARAILAALDRAGLAIVSKEASGE
jgi:hypothetical protein